MYPLIDHKHKLGLFYSPKCACTAVKTYYITIYYPKLRQEPYNDLYKDYKKLWIIRNPYERIVSSFIFLYNFLPNYVYKYKDNKFVKWFKKRYCNNQNIDASYNQIVSYRRHPSFKNFVKILEKIDINNVNKHLTPQTRQYNCIDQVSDVELVDVKDLNDRLLKLNAELGINGSIMKLNCTKHNSDVSNVSNVNIRIYTKVNKKMYPMYKYFYDEELVRSVYNIYKDDFDRFELFAVNWNILKV